MKSALIDTVGLAGLGSLGYGCFLIYQPSAYVVVGACLLAYAIKAGTSK